MDESAESIRADTPGEMEAIGSRIARELSPGRTYYLRGELGAGKTTLVRGVLRELGLQDAVRSPTYTLIETYRFPAFDLHHMDFYRLADPAEFEFLGVREALDGNDVCFVEWPERAPLPPADVEISIVRQADSRLVLVHRRARPVQGPGYAGP